MKIKIENSNPSRKKTEMLCGFVLESSDKILGLSKINSKIADSVKLSLKDNNGELGKITVFPTNNKVSAKRILLAGIGKKEKITNDTFRFDVLNDKLVIISSITYSESSKSSNDSTQSAIVPHSA